MIFSCHLLLLHRNRSGSSALTASVGGALCLWDLASLRCTSLLWSGSGAPAAEGGGGAGGWAYDGSGETVVLASLLEVYCTLGQLPMIGYLYHSAISNIILSHSSQDKALVGSNNVGLDQRCEGFPNSGETLNLNLIPILEGSPELSVSIGISQAGSHSRPGHRRSPGSSTTGDAGIRCGQCILGPEDGSRGRRCSAPLLIFPSSGDGLWRQGRASVGPQVR